MRTIEQLRATLKQEQENAVEVKNKKAELEAKVNKLDDVEESQLAKKSAQLEDEKKKSLEYAQLIEQLRDSAKLDQAKLADMIKHAEELDEKAKAMSIVLSKIASLATGGKLEDKG
jgi:hypothetical protein